MLHWISTVYSPLGNMSSFCPFADTSLIGSVFKLTSMQDQNVSGRRTCLIIKCHKKTLKKLAVLLKICQSRTMGLALILNAGLDVDLLGKLIMGLRWPDLLNSCCFLASDWLSSFLAFADKPLMGFSLNLLGKSIGASPGLINLWSCSAQFPLFPGLWLVKQLPPICRSMCTAYRM